MKKNQKENKHHIFTPSINFTSPNETQQTQIKGIFNNSRSKTPFYRKKSAFTQEEENLSSGTFNKSINNQTFIYNSINFNNQGLFNNISNTNSNNINPKRRKSGGNSYMVNNGIFGFLETMKKSRSISKQKNNNNKYLNIINKLTNTPFFYKNINKHKNKSNSRQKNNSFKNDKKKIINLINNNTPTYLNNTNTLQRKNKHKLSSTNYNNKNLNMIGMINNNNNKINHILASSTSKTKKVKKSTDINLTNKNINTNKNKINLIKNIQFIDSDRNKEIKAFKYSEENNIILTKLEKNILSQIESLILELLTKGSSPKNLLIREIDNTLKKSIFKYNINNKLEIEINLPLEKKSNNSLYFSKKGSKNNLMDDPKRKNKKQNNNNKENIEQELNILNKKYNQIKEENINLKYLITEKTTAFEDVKNSLKNFQLEINQLKTNNTGNNFLYQNINSLRNKNEDYNIDNSLAGNISLNSKGVEMKNINLNLSNIQKLNEIQGIKKEPQEKNTDAYTNKENNNIFNCNNYSFGQNNSFEINLENYNSSQKNFLNSNRSLDPLSLTFHEQTINVDEDNETKQQNLDKEIKEYDFSPSLRKNTEILIKTGMLPLNNKKF